MNQPQHFRRSGMERSNVIKLLQYYFHICIVITVDVYILPRPCESRPKVNRSFSWPGVYSREQMPIWKHTKQQKYEQTTNKPCFRRRQSSADL